MKIISYYKKARPGEHFTFWEDGIGKALIEEIANYSEGSISFGNPIGIFEHCPVHDRYYTVERGDCFEIAYCQMFAIPEGKRPAKFVYTFLSDFIGNEKRVYGWIDKVRPNLLCCLQHCPKELVDFGAERGCKVIMLPWFVIDEPRIDFGMKKIDGMCSGAIGPSYPARTKIAKALKEFPNTIVSCGTFGNYPLDNIQYTVALAGTKYYFSGGIHDRFIPPKYFEVCNYGACLVSMESDEMSQRMKECGFVDGENYIRIFSLEGIGKLLKSDFWIDVARAGRKLVRERHTVKQRAQRILEEYNEFVARTA